MLPWLTIKICRLTWVNGQRFKPLSVSFTIKDDRFIVKQLEKPHAKHYQKTYEKEEFYANIA